MVKITEEDIYVQIGWPEYQKFMDEDWWNKCIVTEKDGKSVSLIPLSKVFETYD